jgi:DHA1 family tetracycline resistance protein-like MFS transporter
MDRRHLIVASSVLVDMMGYGLIMPLLPFIVKSWSSDAFIVGLLGSLYAATQLLVAPILGSLSDRIGRRPVLLLCLFGSALAYLSIALADSIPLLAAAIALGGAAGSSMPVAQAYIADTTTPQHRAHGLGLLGAAFGLGLLGGAAMGGFLSQYGLAVPLALAAAIALGNALYATIALPESLPPHHRHHSTYRLRLFAPVYTAMQIPTVRPLLFAVVLLNIAFAGLQSNVTLFTMTRFGWGPTQNALLFVFVGIWAAITQAGLLKILHPLLGDTRLAGGGMGFMALAFLLVGMIEQSDWLLFPLAAMLAIGMGLAVPTLTSIISQRAGNNRQGAVLGGMQALISLALIVGPLSFGFLFARFGPDTPYLVGGTLLTGAWLVVVWTFLQPIPTLLPVASRPIEDSEA